MKTAISLPDRLFEETETLRQRLGKSRSQLYAEALAEYVARHDAGEITRRLNEVLHELGDEAREQDRAVTAAAADTLRRAEW